MLKPSNFSFFATITHQSRVIVFVEKNPFYDRKVWRYKICGIELRILLIILLKVIIQVHWNNTNWCDKVLQSNKKHCCPWGKSSTVARSSHSILLEHQYWMGLLKYITANLGNAPPSSGFQLYYILKKRTNSSLFQYVVHLESTRWGVISQICCYVFGGFYVKMSTKILVLFYRCLQNKVIKGRKYNPIYVYLTVGITNPFSFILV